MYFYEDGAIEQRDAGVDGVPTRERPIVAGWRLEDYIDHAVKLRRELGEPEPPLPTTAPLTASKDKSSGSAQKDKAAGGGIGKGAMSDEKKKRKKEDVAKDVLAFFGKKKDKEESSSSGSASKDAGKGSLGFSFGAPAPAAASARLWRLFLFL